MKNLTYDQLIELAPKDRPFQIEVGDENSKEWEIIWAYISYNKLYTPYNGFTDSFWKIDYKGTFTFIDPRYTKPEVLKVGQKVRILESARECGDYTPADELEIGTIQEIKGVKDNLYGVSYVLEDNGFPHYCVMPVEEEEEEQSCIPTPFDDMIEEVEELFLKAQEIVDKYKK